MRVICDQCGSPISKYAAIAFDIDYLEAYIIEYFQRSKDFFFTKYPNTVTSRQLRISYAIMKKFSALNIRKIALRYNHMEQRISLYIKSAETGSSDYIFMEKELSGELDFTKHQNKEK